MILDGFTLSMLEFGLGGLFGTLGVSVLLSVRRHRREKILNTPPFEQPTDLEYFLKPVTLSNFSRFWEQVEANPDDSTITHKIMDGDLDGIPIRAYKGMILEKCPGCSLVLPSLVAKVHYDHSLHNDPALLAKLSEIDQEIANRAKIGGLLLAPSREKRVQ